MEVKPFVERLVGAVLTASVIILDALAVALLPPDAALLGIAIWKILVAATAIVALILFHGYHRENRRLRDKLDEARGNFKTKEANLLLARKLSEMYSESPWADIQRLKKNVNVIRGATTAEDVEDVKRRLMVFVKNLRGELVGTGCEGEFGYEDNSDEWARIRDLDTSNLTDSLHTLVLECNCYSMRLSNAIDTIRQSAAAIAANTSSD